MRAKKLLNNFTGRGSRGTNQSVLLASGHTSTDIKTAVNPSYGDIGRIPSLKSLYCEAISRTYKFPTASEQFISVQEIMLETRLSFHIPELYLKLLVDEETRTIGTLNSIKHLTERLQLARARYIETRKTLLEQYQEAVKNIVSRSRNVSFKASIQKTEKELEFVPTNLHLQRMRVQHSDCMSAISVESQSSTCSSGHSAGIHDIVTVGAATAHCLKYKQGGLLSMISMASESLKRGALCSKILGEKGTREITELPVTLTDLHKEALSYASTLQTLFSAGKECNTVPTRKSTDSSISALSDETCKLIALMDNKELCNTLDVLLNQTNGPSGVEWNEMKSSVKTKLADLVKKVHTKLDAADDLLSLQQTSPPPTFDEVLTDLDELSKRLNRVKDQGLQGHAVYLLQNQQETPETMYRRDVVFSQVLSTCICGVLTTLVSSLHNGESLENYAKYGMLVQFESLLSTYKNELGMLEDYIVGVYDLHKVSFCCDRALEREGNDMDHLLPTLHGTRNKVVVKLHLDPLSFSKLPDSLKSGEMFKIIPVMFNVGINEEQTLAEKIGKTSLQDYVNMDSYTQLNAYCQNVKKSSSKPTIFDDCLRKLADAIHSKKNKNVEILHLAAEICRMANGVRVTSCKSAKDRTAMAVTLEQVQVLVQSHELSMNSFTIALNCMRTQGTRRENTRKNVGAPKYAFTSVQLMTFPKQYKPPEGTYGNIQS